jgi:subtilisin-like proprotein convertase family protein
MRRTLVPLLSTRSVVLWGGMLIAVALLIASLAVVPKKAEAATKLVTKSFSNSNQILIPDFGTAAASPYPSAISSSFPRGSKVRDVNVTLRNYTHEFPDDVDVLLVHAGVNRTIMSDVGGGNVVNNITLSLNDESANGQLPDEGQLFDGIFQPTNNVFEGSDIYNSPAPIPASAKSSLSGFDGSRAKGTWKLFVQDDFSGLSGFMAGGWSVKIKAAVPR